MNRSFGRNRTLPIMNSMLSIEHFCYPSNIRKVLFLSKEWLKMLRTWFSSSKKKQFHERSSKSELRCNCHWPSYNSNSSKFVLILFYSLVLLYFRANKYAVFLSWSEYFQKLWIVIVDRLVKMQIMNWILPLFNRYERVFCGSSSTRSKCEKIDETMFSFLSLCL